MLASANAVNARDAFELRKNGVGRRLPNDRIGLGQYRTIGVPPRKIQVNMPSIGPKLNYFDHGPYPGLVGLRRGLSNSCRETG